MSHRDHDKLDYTRYATVTAPPTATLSGSRTYNIIPVSTASGDVSLGTLGTPADLGLKAGQILIFRKVTTDGNHVTWTGSMEGVTDTLRLRYHFSVDLAQIALLVNSANTYELLVH